MLSTKMKTFHPQSGISCYIHSVYVGYKTGWPALGSDYYGSEVSLLWDAALYNLEQFSYRTKIKGYSPVVWAGQIVRLSSFKWSGLELAGFVSVWN